MIPRRCLTQGFLFFYDSLGFFRFYLRLLVIQVNYWVGVSQLSVILNIPLYTRLTLIIMMHDCRHLFFIQHPRHTHFFIIRQFVTLPSLVLRTPWTLPLDSLESLIIRTRYSQKCSSLFSYNTIHLPKCANLLHQPRDWVNVNSNSDIINVKACSTDEH